ncbi:hypothetical protein OIM90_20070 [Streptomyces sp. AD16]|nr:hypothetical protein OIM90_20070 [Streptomyces sp. AD16]
MPRADGIEAAATSGDWYYWGMQEEQEETARSAIDTFISAFNASDDSYVTALLSQALTSDVVFWGPLGRSEGIEAVERFVLDIRRHPAGTGTMVRCSAVDMPDEWARYQWVFTTPDGGPRLAGTDVVHLRRSLIDQVIVFAGRSVRPPPEPFSPGAVLLPQPPPLLVGRSAHPGRLGHRPSGGRIGRHRTSHRRDDQPG